MAKVFITLTGTKHYFGNDFLKKGTKIRLEKEPDNEYDKEAIKVTYEGLGKIGYVANSSYTVIGDSMSAGRLYDRIGKTAYAKVELVTPAGTICKVCKKSLKNEMKETMNDEKSAIGTAIKIPSKPKIVDKIRIHGIKIITCLKRFNTLEILILPIA